MRRPGYRILAFLSPGAFGLLGLMLSFYLAERIGFFSGTFDLYPWLSLSGPGFWQGHFWQILTYFLLPVSFFDFLTQTLMIVVFSNSLERYWSRWTLWGYAVLAILASGLVQIIFFSHSALVLSGATPLSLGLLAAWGYLFGHEKIRLILLGEWSIRSIAFFGAGLGFLMLWFSAGLLQAGVMFAGAGAGLLYLAVCSKWIMSREGTAVHSDRISRLEL